MSRLRLILPYFAPYRSLLLVGLGWLLLTDFLGLLLPWMLKVGVDSAQQGAHRQLLLAAAVLLVGALLRFGTRLLSRFAFLHSACRLEIDLRRDLLSSLLCREGPFFDSHRTGDLLSRCTNDLSNIRTMAGFGLLILLNTVLVYLLTLSLLFSLSPSLTLLALIPYPLLLLLVKYLSGRLLTASSAVQKGLGRISEALEEGISGHAVIRSYSLHGVRCDHFEQLNGEYLSSSLKLAKLRALIGPVMALIAPISTLLILYFGGGRVVAGKLSLGELIAFNAYLMQLAMPTLMLGWVLSLGQRAMASIERLRSLLTPLPSTERLRLAAASTAPTVEIQRLNFAYDGQPVLKDLSLTLTAGSLTGISGTTGSGKSTLLQLLAGFYPVKPGEINIDGQDLTTLDPVEHRQRLAVVPQEGRLFSGTLQDNLLYGVPGADTELLQRVADAVCLSDEVAAFEEGFSTRVGEGGKALSGGQRQRVALGRALARDGSLWLLDDPFSHLDAATARQVWQALQPLLRDKTVLLVSARVSLLEMADDIVILDQGRVAEQGSHVELLALEGRYARLLEQERLKQELEGLA
ncbi:ABC transporter ATP-binding protein [Syntrophotalea acetylenivorans]|uniref:ABC transporter ATP-binding protein n=1 Tax=Syntrophotalea acetylenivorans TaxID=1842532 RepID=UPI0009FA67F7|nr:ABC transporter ATP-binding protein [Syntrophotalea acetylenivorans]